MLRRRVGLDCLISYLDCLISGLVCRISGLDCLISDLGCLISGLGRYREAFAGVGVDGGREVLVGEDHGWEQLSSQTLHLADGRAVPVEDD